MPNARDVYLAQHYLSGPKADFILAASSKTVKPNKRKESSSKKTSLKISDDVDDDNPPEFSIEEEGALIVQNEAEAGSIKFKGSKLSSWSVVSSSAEAPSTQKQIPSGLTSAADLRAMREAESSANLESADKTRKDSKDHDDGKEQETIYRDSSGRILDLETERNRVKAESVANAKREAEKQQWGRGLVQRQEEQSRKEKLEDIRSGKKASVIYADDKELNADLRSVQRWNDPAAAFLKDKPSSNQSSASSTQPPRYSGPAPPPNRFGIPPGYRWDGVDRSNGFEAKAQAAINARAAKNEVEYRWRSSDM